MVRLADRGTDIQRTDKQTDIQACVQCRVADTATPLQLALDSARFEFTLKMRLNRI